MKNKNLLLIIALFFASLTVLGQAPNKIDFQAMARDASSNPIVMQTIGVRISIIEGGSTVYTERHTPQTDDYGLFNIHIGDGSPLSGNFNNIDWSLGNHAVKVEVDPSGGYVYVNMGTSQLTSTPYSLYGEDDDADPANELQTLSIVGNDLTISDGNTVTLPGGGGGSLWTQNGDDIYYDAGKVGIGINSPDKEFHLYNGTGTGGGTYAAMVDAIIEDDTYAYLEFNGEGWAGMTFNDQNESIHAGFFYNYYNERISIKSGGVDDRMIIDADGNVGINNSSPGAKLDVAGDMKLGTSGIVFSQVQEFTGTTGTGHYVTVAYPSGYTRDNTRVLSLEIYFSNNYWASMGTTIQGVEYRVSCLLGSSQIYIYYPDDSGMHNKAFRMILMKTGSAKSAEQQPSDADQSRGTADLR